MKNRDVIMLEEAIRLVEEGHRVIFPVNGTSMLPFIIGGRERLELEQPVDLNIGDVVLAWVDQRRYVVHRIISITDEKVTLQGDGCLSNVEHCLKNDVKAKATHVVDSNDRRHWLYSPWRRCAVRLWYHLRPIRRYLLAIYRRL